MRLVRRGQEQEAGTATGTEWIDVDLDEPGAEEWLAERLDLCESTRELLAEENTNSRRARVPEGLAMRVCYTGEEGEAIGEDSVLRMGLIVTAERMVSVRRGPNRELEAVWQGVLRGSLEADVGWNALALLISAVSDRVESTLDHLAATLDELEDVVFDSGNNLPIDELGKVRRRLIRDRRRISALSRAIEEVAGDRSVAMRAASSEELTAVAQVMGRHERTAAFYLERANLLRDQIQSQLSERMNNATLRLGLVATVFLPLGFLTGLLGINVAGIPGTHDPQAFWLVCVILTGLALGAWMIMARIYRP
ncbi:MAG: CorA family divalent cation transporter [Myxococcota bacterium]|nr:CorA family divalent cation transporter [Myxococcota bacterium]